MGPNNPRQCNLVELEGYGPSTGATMISAYEVGVDQSSIREVSEKVLQGQDTIGYGSNVDRVPWVVSTVSCP